MQTVEEWFVENAYSPEADRLLWELYQTLSVEDPKMARKAFNRFCDKLGIRKNRIPWKVVYLKVQRFAAILAIPLLLTTLALFLTRTPLQEWQELYVPYGHIEKVVLPDSTVIWMNAGSRITYPQPFQTKHRKIFIEGEIFADVKADPRHPFIISAQDFEVTVVGTRFNLKAYAEDPSIEIALVEGLVEVNTKSRNISQQASLKNGEMMVYNKESADVELLTFTPSQYKSFADGGGLHFFNQKFQDITAHLQRLFDVRIVILDNQLAKERYHAYFTNNETIEQMLNTFNVDNSFIIRKEGDAYFISGKTNNNR
ncbi:MAG: DUF4974 domain-containing protein [Ruminiclostridium sp.]|nr:DUF4974 domain-containing protein [Ruminiclostridium sp.]